MKQIKLTRGYSAVVDNRDYPSLSQYRWHCRIISDRKYASRREAQTGRIIYMHREIVGAPKGFDVDHRDRNGLNNRRKNLRVCTRAENSRNSRRKYTNKTGYKGVSFNKNAKQYVAQITINRVNRYLGLYRTARLASIAYETAAKQLYGEFYRPNEHCQPPPRKQ